MRFSNYRYRPNPPITNREGYSNRYARLRRYAPAPSCQNQCSNSQDLFCDQNRDICTEATSEVSGAPSAGGNIALFDSDAAVAPIDIASGMADVATPVTALQDIRTKSYKIFRL